MQKTSKLKQLLLACFVFASSSAFCQTCINVTGNTAKINGMTFDYSIGEMTLISTEKISNLIVTQGLLQPSDTRSSVHDAQPNEGFDHLANLVRVYPNPSENFIFIESIIPFDNQFNFQIIDASGKVVLNKNNAEEISNTKWKANLSALAMGNYFLMIQQKDKTEKTQNLSFKIQKTN